MKYIYTFYIWTVGLLVFLFFAIISIAGMKLVGAKKYFPVFRRLMQLWLSIIFIKPRINGKENFEKGTTYLYMPNHVSIFDAYILTAILPTHTIAIEEKKNFSYPVYGWLHKLYGNIPIDRKNIMRSRHSFKIATDKLKNGQNMIIFPEGGRTINGKLKPFKSLLFLTAHQAGQAIMPIGMNGIYELNKKGSFWMKPSKITINFGKVIPAELVSEMDVEALKKEVRSRLLDLLEPKYRS